MDNETKGGIILKEVCDHREDSIFHLRPTSLVKYSMNSIWTRSLEGTNLEEGTMNLLQSNRGQELVIILKGDTRINDRQAIIDIMRRRR